MISRRELLDTANTMSLLPSVVEKDYALGWALAGIFAHEELRESWVFKGGTCLKKCYFETYRFSEDLDFTLKDASHLQEGFLQRVFKDVGEWIYERTGLEFPADLQDFDIYENLRGNPSCEGKLSYRGPIAPNSGGLPRIKLDLTADERLVMPPVRVPIFHPYNDAPEDGIEVLAYAYEEAFGEKTRALIERTRPRDLYDVINLYRNTEARPSASVLLDVLTQKCEFKGIAVPEVGDLDDGKGEFEGAWETMLAHQLPALPPFNAFWDTLPEFFAWLAGASSPEIPASYALASGETVIRERTLRLPLSNSVQSHLEIIRFGAANQLCIDLDYQGSTRRIEPYSLRRTRDGNILLHAWSVDRDAHRSYRVDRIQGARTTDRTFAPRYTVELTPAGPVSIPPTQRSRSSSRSAGTGSMRVAARPTRRRAARPSSSFSKGPIYIYQCGLCGKKFRRKKRSSKLNKHKGHSAFPCSGRTGVLVDIKY